MNFKDLKLGAKLSTGFGVLIIISVFIGGLAIVNMSEITTESKFLAREYVPEVKVATDLRGAANRAMYAMRGYGFTEENRFYKDAVKEIAAIKDAIRQGEDLQSRAKRLVKLGEELKVAEDATDVYLDLVEQTVEVNEILENDRDIMDQSASLYMSNCFKYLSNQNESMAREIRTGTTNQERLTKITLINEIIDIGNDVRLGNFKSQAKRDPKIYQEALSKFPQVQQKLNEIRRYTKVDADLRALDGIESEAKDYERAMESFIAHWIKREDIALKRDEAGKELIAACAATTDAGLKGTQNIADNAITILESSSTALITGLFIALLIGLAFAIYLTRLITRPLYQGVAFARKLSKGDLTATIEVEQKDEIGELANALTNMASKLREIVETILSGADNIASASQQMAGTSQEMSQGVNEQASSVEEVSSSMEEMVANIQQNTNSAQTTQSIAINAAKGIREGSRATDTAVTSMKNIAEKIRIINDIAFQTNILALNAAVEAARAGEHGKGFAVVAAEVRKLAERSKVAADEIDDLSKNGVETAEQAGSKLQRVVPDIEKTAQLVQEIAAASLEQNTGADQVNNAMQQLNSVTQQNAASSEEMATGSEELASQAEELKQTVLYFNIGQHQVKTTNRIKVPVSTIQHIPMNGNGNGHAENGSGSTEFKIQTVNAEVKNNDNDFENF